MRNLDFVDGLALVIVKGNANIILKIQQEGKWKLFIGRAELES